MILLIITSRSSCARLHRYVKIALLMGRPTEYSQFGFFSLLVFASSGEMRSTRNRRASKLQTSRQKAVHDLSLVVMITQRSNKSAVTQSAVEIFVCTYRYLSGTSSCFHIYV